MTDKVLLQYTTKEMIYYSAKSRVEYLKLKAARLSVLIERYRDAPLLTMAYDETTEVNAIVRYQQRALTQTMRELNDLIKD